MFLTVAEYLFAELLSKRRREEPGLFKATFRLGGGYKQLTEEEVAEIFRQSL